MPSRSRERYRRPASIRSSMNWLNRQIDRSADYLMLSLLTLLVVANNKSLQKYLLLIFTGQTPSGRMLSSRAEKQLLWSLKIKSVSLGLIVGIGLTIFLKYMWRRWINRNLKQEPVQVGDEIMNNILKRLKQETQEIMNNSQLNTENRLQRFQGLFQRTTDAIQTKLYNDKQEAQRSEEKIRQDLEQRIASQRRADEKEYQTYVTNLQNESDRLMHKQQQKFQQEYQKWWQQYHNLNNRTKLPEDIYKILQQAGITDFNTVTVEQMIQAVHDAAVDEVDSVEEYHQKRYDENEEAKAQVVREKNTLQMFLEQSRTQLTQWEAARKYLENNNRILEQRLKAATEAHNQEKQDLQQRLDRAASILHEIFVLYTKPEHQQHVRNNPEDLPRAIKAKIDELRQMHLGIHQRELARFQNHALQVAQFQAATVASQQPSFGPPTDIPRANELRAIREELEAEAEQHAMTETMRDELDIREHEAKRQQGELNQELTAGFIGTIKHMDEETANSYILRNRQWKLVTDAHSELIRDQLWKTQNPDPNNRLRDIYKFLRESKRFPEKLATAATSIFYHKFPEHFN